MCYITGIYDIYINLRKTCVASQSEQNNMPLGIWISTLATTYFQKPAQYIFVFILIQYIIALGEGGSEPPPHQLAVRGILIFNVISLKTDL